MRLNNKKEIKKVDAILTADWHLRDTQPRCRIDNYYETQFKKLTFISDLQMKYNCPVIVAGDVFDIPKPSPMLLASTLHFMPKKIICIPGQHDLPEHNLKNYNQSGLAVIEEGSDCKVLKNDSSSDGVVGFPYGSQLKNTIGRVAVVHTLVQEPKGESNIPANYTCISLMKKLKEFKLIVSGDNHTPFTFKNGEQLLVNPGSLMRMDADQINHRPRVYLWCAKENQVQPIYIPIKEGVVNRDHIEKQKKEDERIEAYKEKLKANVKIGISFEKNMKRFININKINSEVEKEIYAAMEKG
jgi:DNA repair exonuclease SbcCD nuclease subunit